MGKHMVSKIKNKIRWFFEVTALLHLFFKKAHTLDGQKYLCINLLKNNLMENK